MSGRASFSNQRGIGRGYSRPRLDAASTVLFLFLFPVFLACQARERRRSVEKKPLLERLREKAEQDTIKMHQARQGTWNAIKQKRDGESEEKRIKRLKRWGYTPDGVHIRSGICYEKKTEEETVPMNQALVSNLKKWEGETFHTVRGIPFSYTLMGEYAIRICDRRPYNIPITDFEKALELRPTKVSQITKLVRGSSYIFAIINDSRFQ